MAETEKYPCPDAPRIPNTPFPDLRVKDPPPPQDGPTRFDTYAPGCSPSKTWLPEEWIGKPRPSVNSVYHPARPFDPSRNPRPGQ
jgi:hypothetical protein